MVAASKTRDYFNAYRRSPKARAYDIAYLKRPYVRIQRYFSRCMRVYGITKEEWQRQFAAQGYRCAICGTKDPGKTQWIVDRCHKTNLFRGILCRKCNAGIGLLGDTAEKAHAAMLYLGEIE